MMSCLYDNLEGTGWQVFAMREKANQRSERNETVKHCLK